MLHGLDVLVLSSLGVILDLIYFCSMKKETALIFDLHLKSFEV